MRDKNSEMIGVWVTKNDKDVIQELAHKNKMSLSVLMRVLINKSLKNIEGANGLNLSGI